MKLYNSRNYRNVHAARMAFFLDRLKVPFVPNRTLGLCAADGQVKTNITLDFYIESQRAALWFGDAAEHYQSITDLDRLLTNALPVGTKVFYLKGDAGVQAVADFEEAEALGLTASFRDGGEDVPYLWCECQYCGTVGIEFMGRSERINCQCFKGHKDYNSFTDKLVAAKAAAVALWRADVPVARAC